MMSDVVQRTDRDGAATLVLNRPDKRNALNVELFQCLEGHIERLEAQTETIGVVVIRGAGGCFSAGADVAERVRPPRPHYQAKVIERLSLLPQPVVAVVHGVCFTGGLELALAADLIVAAASAAFADTHAKWALTPGWGLSQRLPRRVGFGRAREMMFTCSSYSGAQAAAMGLADLCVADDRLEPEVDALLTRMLGNSWFSHRGNKRLLLETEGMSLAAGLAHETFRGPGVGPDCAARMQHFPGKT
jgi:enoyl-CoA hydratase/carnithine racemase